MFLTKLCKNSSFLKELIRKISNMSVVVIEENTDKVLAIKKPKY